MANYHHAKLPGRVDWPTLASILERDLGLPCKVAAVDAETGFLDIDRTATGLTSALFFTWPKGDPDVTGLTVREGGTAMDVLRAVAAVTGGQVAESDERREWVDVPVTMPPVDLRPDARLAAGLHRLLPLTLAVPLAAECGDEGMRARLAGVMSMRRLAE